MLYSQLILCACIMRKSCTIMSLNQNALALGVVINCILINTHCLVTNFKCLLLLAYMSNNKNIYCCYEMKKNSLF